MSTEVDAARHVVREVERLRSRVQVAGASAVARDLEKILQAARTLAALLAELPTPLGAALEPDARRRARHELRTPLNQILGYCELLEEEAEDAGDERWRADLSSIAAQARALLALFDRVGEEMVATAQTVRAVEHAGVPSIVEAVDSSTGLVGSGPLVVRDEQAGQGTVLVVDDNVANRGLLQRRLSRDGFTVLTAADGVQALEAVRSQPVDVVLLDIMMPAMDGYETLDRIKTDPELRHLPVIMLTSLDEAESIARCIERGAEDHLPKPFDPVLLRARIGSSLERKRARDLEREYLRRIVAEKKRADDLLHGVIPIGVALSAERDFNRLLERVLREARRFCGADGGALLLREGSRLSHVLLQCATLDLSFGATGEVAVDRPSLDLDTDAGSPAALAAREGRTVNITDVTMADGVDLGAVRSFDEQHAYRTHSLIALPLRTVCGDVIGVLELWNATRASDGESVPFDAGLVDVLDSLSRLAGAAMDSYRRETDLRQRIRRLEIRIDEANRRREVSEITETDYFRKLRAMAQKLRGEAGTVD